MSDDTPRPHRPFPVAKFQGLAKKGEARNPNGVNSGRNNKVKEYKFAREKATELGVDPFEVLLLFAGNRSAALNPGNPIAAKMDIPLDLRLKAAIEAAKYVHPTLKAVEHTNNSGGPLAVYLEMTQGDLARRYNELQGVLGPGTIESIADQATDDDEEQQEQE
jgi:hypothetical protein